MSIDDDDDDLDFAEVDDDFDDDDDDDDEDLQRTLRNLKKGDSASKGKLFHLRIRTPHARAHHCSCKLTRTSSPHFACTQMIATK